MRLILGAIITTIVIRDLSLLFTFPIAVGTDGYYYVAQIDALRSSGALQYPNARPLVFYLLAPLSIALDDSILAIKVGGVLLHAILATGIYAFTKRVTNDGIAGLTAASLIYASNNHLYFISEFINNLAALAFIAWAVYFSLCPRLWWISGLLILAAIFSHRSAPVIVALAVGIPSLLFAIRHLSRQRALMATVLVSTAFWMTAWLVRGKSSGPENPFQGAAALELIVLGIAALLSATRASDLLLRAASVLSLGVTLSPFLDRAAGLESIGGRVSLLAHVQIAVILPLLIVRSSSHPRPGTAGALVVLAVTFALLNLSRPIPRGLSADFLLRRLLLIEGLHGVAHSVPTDSIVIAPHGDQFIVTYILRVASQNRIPTSDARSPVFWLIRLSPRTFEAVKLVKVSNQYVLIESSELTVLQSALSGRDKLLLVAANPHLRTE